MNNDTVIKILGKYNINVEIDNKGKIFFNKKHILPGENQNYKTTDAQDLDFMKRVDLEKICEEHEYLLENRHNDSPTIKDFIDMKEQVFFNGRVEIDNNEIQLDIDGVYIPLEYEDKKFNKIVSKIHYGIDTVEKKNVNYKDYLYLWWD